MARKNLLKDLMSGEDQPAAPAPDIARPKYSKGAIGAVSKSIADLKSRAVIELDPHAISDAGLTDRLEHDEAEHARLMNSLKDHGQQVPILVRPHPDDDEKFQIVYGRRRVLAMRDLGLPVKAMIRDLDDGALVMAQGQENNARKNLSFIEKANFASQMIAADYDRKAICDAINVDKTVISRMLQVTDALPVELIQTIGSAPGTGRNRWMDLARLWSADVDVDLASDMIAAHGATASDDRFQVVLDWLQTRGKTPVKAPKKTPRTILRSHDGARIGEIKRSGSATTLTLHKKDAAGFDKWIESKLADLHRDWLASREDGSK